MRSKVKDIYVKIKKTEEGNSVNLINSGSKIVEALGLNDSSVTISKDQVLTIKGPMPSTSESRDPFYIRGVVRDAIWSPGSGFIPAKIRVTYPADVLTLNLDLGIDYFKKYSALHLKDKNMFSKAKRKEIAEIVKENGVGEVLEEVITKTLPGSSPEVLAEIISKVEKTEAVDVKIPRKFTQTAIGREDILDLLKWAKRYDYNVFLNYKDMKGDSTKRRVRPVSLANFVKGKKNISFILAFCYKRQDIRKFMIDRIESVMLGEKDDSKIPEGTKKEKSSAYSKNFQTIW